MAPHEELQGFGNGGSESLVLFVNSPGYGAVVRKICSEELASVEWDPAGAGVMAPPSTKAGLQVAYLEALPDAVRPYFPAVFNTHRMTVSVRGKDGEVRRVNKLVYDQTMLHGTEVSTFVAEHRPTPGVVAHLHREILRCLADRIHPHRRAENAGATIHASYLGKIVKRLEMSQRAAPESFTPLLTSNRIVINGQSYRNIGELLTFFGSPEVTEVLEPPCHSLVMGDTNTENVMITRPEPLLAAMEQGHTNFTYDDIGMRFLDPRAIGFDSEGATTRDDRMYDNKPLHNTLGQYDVIHGEHFQLGVQVVHGVPYIRMQATPDNPYSRSYQDMGQYFRYVMGAWAERDEFAHEDPNWLVRFSFIMGTHFAAMPPFHFKKGPDGTVPDDPEYQKRAVAIYCKGVEWLNKAYDMLNGVRRELYGVAVPETLRTAAAANRGGA